MNRARAQVHVVVPSGLWLWLAACRGQAALLPYPGSGWVCRGQRPWSGYLEAPGDLPMLKLLDGRGLLAVLQGPRVAALTGGGERGRLGDQSLVDPERRLASVAAQKPRLEQSRIAARPLKSSQARAKRGGRDLRSRPRQHRLAAAFLHGNCIAGIWQVWHFPPGWTIPLGCTDPNAAEDRPGDDAELARRRSRCLQVSAEIGHSGVIELG